MLVFPKNAEKNASIIEKGLPPALPIFIRFSRFIITRDALRAARVKKRVGYLFRRRRRVFIFLRRSHK